MKRSTKIWLTAAIILTLLGGATFVTALSVLDWNFEGLSTVQYVTTTYELQGDFDKISIDVDITKIEFEPSKDDTCSIACFEMENSRHSATVKDGTLVINTADTCKWYDYIGIFSFKTPKLTLFLPQKEYQALLIETDTGDITIPGDFTFQSIEIEGDTADINIYASVPDTLNLELSTGDITIGSARAGSIELNTSTGDVTLKNGNVKGLIVNTDTGDVMLSSAIVEKGVDINTSTGDVTFDGCDAPDITVNTDTGDVTGTLLSEKIFSAESDTGRISLPNTTTGGICEINTDTGDIKLDIK